MRRILIALALLLALPAAAHAAYESNFFRGNAAYCYFNTKTLTWRIGNDALERVVQFDREAGALKTVAVKINPPNAPIAPVPGPEGEFTLTSSISGETTSSAVRLDSNWAFGWQSVANPAHGGRLLTIHLYGKGRYQGYEVEAMYEIYPGNRPYLAKSFVLINRTGSPRILTDVLYDRWVLLQEKTARPPAKRPGDAASSSAEFVRYPGSSSTLTDPAGQRGLVAGVLHPQGVTTHQDGAVALRLHSRIDLQGNGDRVFLPKAIVAPFSGGAASGAFLYQLYVGTHHALGDPMRVPVAYHTRSYGTAISAATCTPIIPLAAQIGAKVFILGDGWQSNIGGSGGYGDWEVDRRPEKFPNGLGPISALIKRHDMQMGLWFSPTRVSGDASVIRQNPQWLLPQSAASGSTALFLDGWAHALTVQFSNLVNYLDVTYLLADLDRFVEGDAAKGQTAYRQTVQWEGFVERLRAIRSGLTLARISSAVPEAANEAETFWIAPERVNAESNRSADADGWYRSADSYRRALYDRAWVMPPFTLSGETPCHISGGAPDLNALEYHFTSVGAYLCNVAWSGSLDQMTPEERALCRKWSQWSADNRPWLAYTQPILSRPWDPTKEGEKPRIDGVLHLRPALYGRYGYICLWNPGPNAERTTVAFQPSAYRLDMKTGNLEIVRIKDGASVAWRRGPAAEIQIDVSMAGRSWEIYELRQRSAGQKSAAK